MRIAVQICTKDRVTELCLLLQSLREQTFQAFDIFVLDDNSGTPIGNFHFFNSLATRMKFEGHDFVVIRNGRSVGAAKARQQLVDYCLKHSKADLFFRVDDDTILAPDYLNTLVCGLVELGADIISGVTPPLGAPITPRPLSAVDPVINRVVLDETGRFVVNCDDCGHTYDEGKVLLAHHFRSNALIKRTVHEKVSYPFFLGRHSFREEEFFSLDAISKGFKIMVSPAAIAWHLGAPSGGERSHASAQADSFENQKLLNRFVKRLYAEKGDFIAAYNEKYGVADSNPLVSVQKQTNLIFTTEE